MFDYRLPGGSKLGGTFQSEVEFNNHIGLHERLTSPPPELSHNIYFTHADLNPTNILISVRLSGIVDFGVAGFYPGILGIHNGWLYNLWSGYWLVGYFITVLSGIIHGRVED